VDIFRPAFSNAAAALVRPGRSKRHAADGFCVTNSHRDRDYYEHTSFDATDVPVQVASQQPPEAQETMFRKGFSAPRTPPPALVGMRKTVAWASRLHGRRFNSNILRRVS
jgi:hypothetical protein